MMFQIHHQPPLVVLWQADESKGKIPDSQLRDFRENRANKGDALTSDTFHYISENTWNT